jgi:hypothetical protein
MFSPILLHARQGQCDYVLRGSLWQQRGSRCSSCFYGIARTLSPGDRAERESAGGLYGQRVCYISVWDEHTGESLLR